LSGIGPPFGASIRSVHAAHVQRSVASPGPARRLGSGATRAALDDAAADAGIADAADQRARRGQRHFDLVRHLRQRPAGRPAAWRAANSNYWGNQVPALAETHRVIVMDSRGHGRSTRDTQPYGYALMASDVIGLMDYLGIPQAAIVGWSDGAILGLSLAMSHPDRVSRLFAFAANSDPSGVKDVDKSPVFNEFIARAEKEYEALSATPAQYKSFVDEISAMWATQPHWTAQDLNAIRVPTWIVDADHDEAIHRENTEFMARQIPNAGLLLQPEVSHFSMLQAPRQFTDDVRHFLERKWD
jgi:pimeloyl-ACP methyl ester carboxylesterase